MGQRTTLKGKEPQNCVQALHTLAPHGRDKATGVGGKGGTKGNHWGIVQKVGPGIKTDPKMAQKKSTL